MTDIKELTARLLSFGVTSPMILREDVHEAAHLLLHLQNQCEEWEVDYTWAAKKAVDNEHNAYLADMDCSKAKVRVEILEKKIVELEEELKRLKHQQAESGWREEYRRNMMP